MTSPKYVWLMASPGLRVLINVHCITHIRPHGHAMWDVCIDSPTANENQIFSINEAQLNRLLPYLGEIVDLSKFDGK
jgi:hypothetical protein